MGNKSKEPVEAKQKKTLSEMTFDELLISQRVIQDVKNDFVRVQNYASASQMRAKEVRISAELTRRIEENFEI